MSKGRKHEISDDEDCDEDGGWGSNSSSDDEDERWDEDDDSNEDADARMEKELKKEMNALEYLTEEEVSAEMKEIVDKAVGYTQRSAAEMRVWLNKYRWSTEILLDHLYTMEEVEPAAGCCSPTAFERDGMADCEICCGRFSPVEMAALSCGHQFCKSCWREYMRGKIVDQGVDSIGCPAHGCSALAEDETVSELVEDASIRTMYKKLVLEKFVQNNPSLLCCTGANCNYFIKMKSSNAKAINCKCRNTFCSGCKLIDHEPIRCDLYRRWLDNPIKEKPADIKYCPKCRTTMEKNGGCNHMHCRQCGHHFCWMCFGDWDKHNNDYYNCNVYKSTTDHHVNDYSIYLETVKRFKFYKERHDTHERSIRLERNLESKVLNVTEYLASRDDKLKECLTILRDCRRTLMNSFAFAFFLEDSGQRKIFELNQNFLHQAVEQLSETMERKIPDTHAAHLRESVMDAIQQSLFCRKRQRELIDHANEGYDKGYWRFREFNFHDLKMFKR